MRASTRTPMSAGEGGEEGMLGSIRADATVSAQTHVRVRADNGVRPCGRPMSARTAVFHPR
jgi:hypothetical protein